MKKSYKQEILNILEKKEKSFTAKELHRLVPKADLVTIYRNLAKLVEENLVKELLIVKGESLFEVNKNDHEHAICDDCGKVHHIKINKDKIKDNLQIPGFDIEDIEIIVRGKCSE